MPDSSFKDYVLDQLRDAGPIACRAMFGGYGLYLDGRMFGIIHRERLYLKVDDASRAAYVERGMHPFQPGPKQRLTSYYEAPPDIIEDGEQLAGWAATAATIGR